MNVAAEDAFDPFAPSDRAVSDHNAAATTNPVEGRQLPRRRAQFDYENRNPDEVAFAANDIIVVQGKHPEDDGWLIGVNVTRAAAATGTTVEVAARLAASDPEAAEQASFRGVFPENYTAAI
jgi:hypothetical protein